MTDPAPSAAFVESHMRRAIALSEIHSANGVGGPFGAVIVRGSEIIAEGWNEVLQTHDPTAHAEVTAIRKATQTVGSHHLTGCTLYSSCEPCPMCLGAAIWAKVDRIYYAADRSDADAIGFSDQWMYEEISAPHDARRLPISQRLQNEAQTVFRHWQDNHGHNTY